MRKQSINIYLTVLALYDNGVLIFSVLMLNLPAITEYQQMPAMYDNMEIVLSPDMLPSTPVADTPLAYRDSNLSSFDFVTGRSPDIDSSSLFMRVNDSSNQENDTDDPPRHYQLSSVKRWHKSFLHKSKQHQVRHGNLNQRAENFTDVKQNLENVLSEYYKRDQLRLLRIAVLQCFNQTSVPDSAMTALPPSAPREIAYPRFNCSDCEDNPNVHMSEAVSRKLLIQMLRRTISYVSGNSDNGWESQVSSSPRRPQYSWKCQNSLLNLVGRYNKQSRQIESTSSSASTRLKTLHGVAFANTSLTDSAIDSEGEYLFSKNPMQHSLLRPNITSSSTLNFSAQEIEFEARTANSKSGSSSNLYPLVHYVKLVYPLALISQTGSIWTTCLITIERYLAVCHPLMSLTLSTRSRAIWALSLLSALAFLFNLPRFLEVDTTGGSVRPTDLRRNKVYYYVYYICLNLTFNYIVPLSLLSALNIKIYSRVRHANSHRNEMTTARQSELHLASMLVAIVAIFIGECWHVDVDGTNVLCDFSMQCACFLSALFGTLLQRRKCHVGNSHHFLQRAGMLQLGNQLCDILHIWQEISFKAQASSGFEKKVHYSRHLL